MGSISRPQLMATTSPPAFLYYGIGIGLGILSFASLGMRNFFGHQLRMPWNRRRNDHVLEQTISQKDSEIVRLQKALSTAETKTKKTERELENARKEVEHVNRRRLDLESQARGMLMEKEVLENELGERSEELGGLRRDLQKAQESLEQARTLLDIRTSELKVAEAFLSRSDRYAGADIMKMIETLNSEIHQTSSIMADIFSPELHGPGARAEGEVEGGVHEAVAHTEEVLGEAMTKMLQTFNNKEENVLLQIAFQASMCAFTEWIMDSWCYHDRDSEVEMVLQETYEQLREIEEQPVSARWRILTRKYARQLYPPVEQPNLAYHIFAACANILIVAGLHESEQHLLDTLAARFSDRVALIVERAIHLNNAIGDDVTSCEFVPIYCTPEVIFDPTTMENASSDSTSEPSEDKILCTTDLGLLRAEKVQGEDRTWHNTILLKPKIVMASSLTVSPTSSESPGWKAVTRSSESDGQEGPQS